MSQNNTAYVIVQGSNDNPIVPSTINGKGIIIGDYAYKNSNLEILNFLGTPKRIEPNAFVDSKIKRIFVPWDYDEIPEDDKKWGKNDLKIIRKNPITKDSNQGNYICKLNYNDNYDLQDMYLLNHKVESGTTWTVPQTLKIDSKKCPIVRINTNAIEVSYNVTIKFNSKESGLQPIIIQPNAFSQIFKTLQVVYPLCFEFENNLCNIPAQYVELALGDINSMDQYIGDHKWPECRYLTLKSAGSPYLYPWFFKYKDKDDVTCISHVPTINIGEGLKIRGLFLPNAANINCDCPLDNTIMQGNSYYFCGYKTKEIIVKDSNEKIISTKTEATIDDVGKTEVYNEEDETTTTTTVSLYKYRDMEITFGSKTDKIYAHMFEPSLPIKSIKFDPEAKPLIANSAFYGLSCNIALPEKYTFSEHPTGIIESCTGRIDILNLIDDNGNQHCFGDFFAYNKNDEYKWQQNGHAFSTAKNTQSSTIQKPLNVSIKRIFKDTLQGITSTNDTPVEFYIDTNITTEIGSRACAELCISNIITNNSCPKCSIGWESFRNAYFKRASDSYAIINLPPLDVIDINAFSNIGTYYLYTISGSNTQSMVRSNSTDLILNFHSNDPIKFKDWAFENVNESDAGINTGKDIYINYPGTIAQWNANSFYDRSHPALRRANCYLLCNRNADLTTPDKSTTITLDCDGLLSIQSCAFMRVKNILCLRNTEDIQKIESYGLAYTYITNQNYNENPTSTDKHPIDFTDLQQIGRYGLSIDNLNELTFAGMEGEWQLYDSNNNLQDNTVTVDDKNPFQTQYKTYAKYKWVRKPSSATN